MINKCTIEYCNFKNGYLKISVPEKKNDEVKVLEIDLTDYEVKNGAITRIDDLAEEIKRLFKENNIKTFQSPQLLLRCYDVFKNTMYITIKNSWQARRAYNKDIKSQANAEDFYTVFNSYEADSRFLFHTYYMPKEIVDPFLRLAKLLGCEISEAKPYGMYIAENISSDETYVYCYIRDGVCTMLLSSNSNLITCIDFEFEDEDDIRRNFLLVASRYEMESDKIDITHCNIDSDKPISLPFDLKRIPKEKINF